MVFYWVPECFCSLRKLSCLRTFLQKATGAPDLNSMQSEVHVIPNDERKEPFAPWTAEDKQTASEGTVIPLALPKKIPVKSVYLLADELVGLVRQDRTDRVTLKKKLKRLFTPK